LSVITSTKNPQIKHLRSLLTNRKDRRSERLFVIEGVRLLEEALAAAAEFAIVVYDPEQLSTTERGVAMLEQISALPHAYAVTPEVLQAVSDTVTPQGVVAAVRWPVLEAPIYGVVLVLDALQDPGNVGTLLRSAVATGVGQVICTAGTADVYSPKVARSAMGAHFRLSIVQDLAWDDAPLMLSTVDNVYAAVAEASMPYYAADWRQPSALIIGNEANGVSAAGLEVATKQIAIPMAPGVESLNAAVAGSVILFEMQRQRRLGRS
jgi:RNA methyltransferase, TrmH family